MTGAARREWAASTFLMAISSRDAPCNSGTTNTKSKNLDKYVCIWCTVNVGSLYWDGIGEDGLDFGPLLFISRYKVHVVGVRGHRHSPTHTDTVLLCNLWEK